MTGIKDFTDFEAFRQSREFVKQTGKAIRTYRLNRDFDLVRQMRKASISVLSNFAEGFDREGNNEFVQFLTYSKGSIGEVRGQLIYAVDQELLPGEKQIELDELGKSASRLVGGLITYLSSCNHRGRKYLHPQEPKPSSRRIKRREHRRRRLANRKLKTVNRAAASGGRGG
jgi:four helix bundle protein